MIRKPAHRTFNSTNTQGNIYVNRQKAFAVGNGDMFYVQHNSDNFTIIDCNLNAETASERIEELKLKSQYKGITSFVSTHPDQDHFGGIELLDEKCRLLIST